MYSYIIGKVVEINASSVTIENNGIGYLVYTPNPYSFKLEETKIFLYQNVKEDELTLYGFKTIEAKELFLKLIGVKGVGPKMALPIVGFEDVEKVSMAIDTGDVTFLKKFPKVGDKVARQIILDLQGKLVVTENISNNYEELESALGALGYKKADIKKIVKDIDPNLEVEEQIKIALGLLLK